MLYNNYNYIIGKQTSFGFVYQIQGDGLSAFTKKDCEYRIRQLYNGGSIGKEQRDYLLSNLKRLKRPD